MQQTIPVGTKSFSDYTHIAGKEMIEEVRELAKPLEGARVLHLSATAFGGGVAEILFTEVPLMNDLGLHAEWHVLYGEDEFFDATKTLHNALQGAPESLTDEQWAVWQRYNEINAEQLEGNWDFVIVHDPQPAAIASLVPEKSKHWLWRCHIDLSTPNPASVEHLLPFINVYPDALFHRQEYVPAGLESTVRIVPPSIDPLAPKNMALAPEDASYICNQFGLDVERPLLCQVSRFDPWKDPLGVIDAYRKVKTEIPGVQLALVGSMAHDDPEGWHFFQETVTHADNDPDIHILHNFNNVGAIEVNAFQSQADITLQKSTREGFGLTVSEALWKGRPVVAGDVGGIPLQITNGESGFLVSTVDACADRCTELLKNPELGRQLGRIGKEHVRANFLSPRKLRDWFRVFGERLEND